MYLKNFGIKDDMVLSCVCGGVFVDNIYYLIN